MCAKFGMPKNLHFLILAVVPCFGVSFKKTSIGVPVVAQWLTNPTRNHEVAGSIPALARWVRIRRCRELWCRLQTRLRSRVAVALIRPLWERPKKMAKRQKNKQTNKKNPKITKKQITVKDDLS